MIFEDKFGSVLICIGKPKVSTGRGEWAWPSFLSLLYFYCNLISDLLHVLIINPKGLEVHPIGSIPGHTTIFELALQLILFYVVTVLNPLFVCLFVHSFTFLSLFKCVTIQI